MAGPSLRDETGTSETTSSEAQTPTLKPPRIVALGLPYDALMSFVTRCIRMFNYGSIAPVFFLYCLEIGLNELQTGTLLTCILVGDLVITLVLSTRADRFGRRRTLEIGAALKILAGVAFSCTSNYYVLVAAGIVGVISTSGGEIGPFIAIEQACLTDSVLAAKGIKAGTAEATSYIAILYGWYNAVGYVFQAIGALCSGLAVEKLQEGPYDWSALDAYRAVFICYGCLGAVMAGCYSTLSSACEPTAIKAAPLSPQADAGDGAPRSGAAPKSCLNTLAFCNIFSNYGLRRAESKYIVARLSLLFTLDAFAGAFVMQTWIAFWFNTTWSFDPSLLGYLLMASNIVAGASGIAAAYFVKKYGAMLTMIASHLPSNILLLAVPLMPTSVTAACMLVARFTISQMDVPARQSYVAMVVASDERSAAGGITNIVRSLGMSLAPSLLGYLSSASRTSPLFSSPWWIAGGLKIVYDITLYSLYICGSGLRSNEASAADKQKAEAKQAADTGETDVAAPPAMVIVKEAIEDADLAAQPLLDGHDDEH